MVLMQHNLNNRYRQCFDRYVLSCGKDSVVRLWDVGSGRQVKQYVGAEHEQMRCQVSVLV